MKVIASIHANPLLVRSTGAPPTALQRAGIGPSSTDAAHREKFIQDLVHDHPDAIPMKDIEPAFTPLISVCRELETPAGFLDNFWITPDGGIVLGECKLFRNAQARREVVVQALDYARAVSSFSVEELEVQAARARKEPGFKLWSLVADDSDLDEARFHDAVQRRLAAGHLMVLVIGDGIQQGAEALTAYLQMHAGFHAGLALVDLSVWELEDGARIVVPRVPMRTVLVERAVVRVEHGASVRVVAPSEVAPVVSKGNIASEVEYYEQLQSRRPDWVKPLQEFAGTVAEAGVIPEFRKSLVLRFTPSPDFKASAGYVDSSGYVWLSDSATAAARAGDEEAGRRYLRTIAEAVGGTVREGADQLPGVNGRSGRNVSLADLLPVVDAWIRAIGEFVSALSRSAARDAGGTSPSLIVSE